MRMEQLALPFADMLYATRIQRVSGIALEEAWLMAKKQAVKRRPGRQPENMLYLDAAAADDPAKIGFLLTLEKRVGEGRREQVFHQTVFVGDGPEIRAYLCEQSQRIVYVLPGVRSGETLNGKVVDDRHLLSPQRHCLMVIPPNGFPPQRLPGKETQAGLVTALSILRILKL